MDIEEGYNEKYPSGLRKVTLWPPLSRTLTFDALAAKPDPFKLKPTTQKKIETLTAITYQEKDLKHTLVQGVHYNITRIIAL